MATVNIFTQNASIPFKQFDPSTIKNKTRKPKAEKKSIKEYNPHKDDLYKEGGNWAHINDLTTDLDLPASVGATDHSGLLRLYSKGDPIATPQIPLSQTHSQTADLKEIDTIFYESLDGSSPEFPLILSDDAARASHGINENYLQHGGQLAESQNSGLDAASMCVFSVENLAGVSISKQTFCEPRAPLNAVADSSPERSESYEDISMKNQPLETRKRKYDVFDITSTPIEVLHLRSTLAPEEIRSEERPTTRSRTKSLPPNPSYTLTPPPLKTTTTTPQARGTYLLPLNVGNVESGRKDNDANTLDLLLFGDIKVATPISQPLPSPSSQTTPSGIVKGPLLPESVSESNGAGFSNLPQKDRTNEEYDYFYGHSQETAELVLSPSQSTSSFEAKDKRDINLSFDRRGKNRQGSSYSDTTSQDALHSDFSENEDKIEEDTSNDTHLVARGDGINKGNMRSPKQKRLPWLESDKQRLLSYKNKMGMAWADIFERFPNCTPGAIRLRYYILAVGDTEYEVEEILESRIRNMELQYRAKWTGYESDPVWYDASNFKNSVQRLHAFHESDLTQPGPPKRLEDWTGCYIEDRDHEDHSDDDEPCDEGVKEVLCRNVGLLLSSM